MRFISILFLSLLSYTAYAAPTGGGGAGDGGSGGSIPATARGSVSPSAIIDLTPFFAPAINDRYDANGSMYNALIPSSDATSDFISAGTIAGSQAPPCTATQCDMALPGGDGVGEQALTLPADFRYMLCRDSTAGLPGYTPCSGTSGPGTCTSTIGTTRTRSFPIVIHHTSANAYVPYGIVSLSDATCQGTGSFTVNIVPNLIAGTSANGTGCACAGSAFSIRATLWGHE